MHKTWLIPLLVAAAVLAWHAQSPAKETDRGLGVLPRVVVELYDAGTPGGWIEIEAERDGRVIEAETWISVNALPSKVLEVAKRQLDAKVIGAEMERTARGRAWEVQMEKDGLKYEFVIDDEGTVVEREIELAKSDWPAAAVRAAKLAIPGGEVKSVERVESLQVAEHHVKLSRNGASYKVVLGPEGTVTRKVREAKAEIEIPLP